MGDDVDDDDHGLMGDGDDDGWIDGDDGDGDDDDGWMDGLMMMVILVNEGMD